MQKIATFLVLLMAAGLLLAQEPDASKAIAAIIEDFFVNQSINFDFIIYRCPLVKLVDEISQLVKAPAKVLQLESIDKLLAINQSAILLFNESARFMEFYAKTNTLNEYPRKLHLFVYIQNFKAGDFSQFYFNPWNTREICNYIYFLVNLQLSSSIDLVTTAAFQQPNCRLLQPKVINHFSKASKKWESRKFTEEKFRNFNGCEIVIVYDENAWTLLTIFKAIDSNLNFESKILPLKSATYADFSVYLHSMRMIESFQIEGKNVKGYTLTHYVRVRDLVFYISRSAPYTILEKALLPLDSDVWFWLIGFLVIGVVVIFILSLMSQNIRNIVIGMSVSAPLLNMM
jgi:hypothetical protein